MVASYVHRRSDLIASYSGLKRRRSAAAAVRQRDSKAGLTTAREPTSREIRMEIFQQISSELEATGGREMALAQLLNSIPTSLGHSSRKKLRAKVRN